MKQQKLFLDTRPVKQPEGTYPYGKNGVQHDLLDSVFNEPGFEKMSAVTPFGLMGVIETDDKPILFSTDNTNSAIGYFNTAADTYEPIVNDDPANLVNWPANGELLEFNQDNYITGESQRNYKGQTVIAFTDKVKFPKYVNCDVPAINRLDDVRLFPVNTTPLITLTEGLGGSNPAGTYYIAINYEKYDGAATAHSEVSDGITLSPGDFGTDTDKSILITLNNVDQDYNFIRISIISRVKGVTKAVEMVDLVPIAGPVVDVLYTGDNLTRDIDVSEILTPGAIYDRVGTIGQLNDALYLGRLHKEPDINDMQQYAAQVVLEWKSELINAITPPAEHIAGTKKSFMHEEVYAFYIRYRKTRGGFTKAFTIPGQQPVSGDLLDSTEADTGSGASVNIPKYKVDDTIHAFNAGTFSGTPGVWVNDTELYPNTVDFNTIPAGGTIDYRNTAVLHHKMPSLRWCKANLYSANNDYGRTELDLLGITPSNIIIPAKYTGILDGYQILYAKRTSANQTIHGQGALLHGVVDRPSAGSPIGTPTIYTSGGNWTTDVWHNSAGDYDDNWELQEVRRETMRFHAFDVLFYKPSMSPSFISNQFKLKRDRLQIEGYLEDGGDNGNIIATSHLVDYTLGLTPVVAPAGQFLRSVTSSFYMQNGISVGKFVNSQHETTFAGMLGGPLLPLSNGNSGIRIRGQSYTEPAVGSPFFEETHLINLLTVKGDIYNTFYSQHLVSAGQSRDLANLTTVWGGDTFVCPYTFHTYGRHDIVDTEGAGGNGIKVIRRIVCESSSNIHLRYEIPGNDYSKWYPHTSVAVNNPAQCYITTLDRSRDPNQFGYSQSLGALNDFISGSIFNTFFEELVDFPYRIHRTGKLSRQTRPRNWRTALPLDYYECQKNMGFIINLNSYNDRLIIHHENALFLTQDKAKLEAGLLNITLGTGDIFQFEPQEAENSKLGIAGTQHDLACIKTPIGYIFPDSKQGEIYLFKDKLIPLYVGANTFLRNALKGVGTNPYKREGITMAWDQKYKRILLTVNSQEIEPFTMSYSVKGQGWAFFHDYIPLMYIHQREQLFSAFEDNLYKHHTGVPGRYYQADIDPPKSFFIDVVFNAETEMLLESIMWMSDYIYSNGEENMFLTLTHIAIWNSQQHSGRITLQENVALTSNRDNRRTRGEWNFNDFRNILKEKGTAFLDDIFNDYNLLAGTSSATLPWYFKELLQDNWFCVRFEFDNVDDAQLILHETNLQVQKAIR